MKVIIGKLTIEPYSNGFSPDKIDGKSGIRTIDFTLKGVFDCDEITIEEEAFPKGVTVLQTWGTTEGLIITKR